MLGGHKSREGGGPNRVLGLLRKVLEKRAAAILNVGRLSIVIRIEKLL